MAASDVYSELLRGEQEVYMQNCKAMDSQMIYIGAGTLGLSLAFVSELVNLPDARWLPVLILSWFALTASIITNLFGFRFVTRLQYLEESLDIGKQLTGLPPYDEVGPDPAAATERTQATERQRERFNKWSFWLLVIGLVAMIVFVAINTVLQSSGPITAD